jgi:subtilase family serine protease
MTGVRAVGAMIAVGAIVLGSLAWDSPARAAGSRVPVPGTHPSWAVPARRFGPAGVTAGTVNVRVYLAGRDPAGLSRYAAAVSTPGNALYHRYLSPAQAMARFGPAQAQVPAVRSWLASAGLTVTAVRAGQPAGGYVAARGPVSAAQKAFAITFAIYRGPDGRLDRAPQRAAAVPASVAPSVLAISGLDTARHLMRPALTALSPLTAVSPVTARSPLPALPPPGPTSWRAPPCSAYYGQKTATGKPTAAGRHQPWLLCGYTPRQLRGAYGVTASGMTGRGQTVAVVDPYHSPTMPADANRYAALTGDPPFLPGQYRQYQAGPFTLAGPRGCDAQSWYTVQAIAVEAVHGMAPAATVHYIAAGSCDVPDMANALATVVNRHLATIVDTSWFSLEDNPVRALFDTIFQVGASEGTGFAFSAGNRGYNSPLESPISTHRQVEYPASDPWVTSVGGTSLAIGPNHGYRFETSWGTLADPLGASGTSWSSPPPGRYPANYGGSGGGGVSTLYRQPFYQRSVVPGSLARRLPDGSFRATPMRVIPDVSVVADPSTGFLIGLTALQPDGKTHAFSLTRVGGTGEACAVFAGIEADAQQAAGFPLGFASPAIYARYRTTAFHDVTDHPLGPGLLFLVRRDYTGPAARKGPLVTSLVSLGINGGDAAALKAVPGYDEATGVGSPYRYVQSFAPGARFSARRR